MLGRRQLREKVLQSIYAYKSSDAEGERVIEKNMLKGVDDIYDLYLYLLNLLKFQQSIAEHKLELAKEKKLPTAEDLNPNLKFVKNSIFKILNKNKELNEYVEKNKQLTWSLLDTYPNNIYKEIIASSSYKEYMQSTSNKFNEDRTFIIQVFKNFIAPSNTLHEFLEEQNIHWANDLHIANSMVVATLKSFTAKSDENIKLYKVYKNEEDKVFTCSLFRETIKHQSETKKIIEETASNWEFDRIALIDLILLQMALTEFIYFPNIPPKVTLNEYIELSKIYSTEKSNIFINGILDRSLKNMQNSNKLSKQGRGLL